MPLDCTSCLPVYNERTITVLLLYSLAHILFSRDKVLQGGVVMECEVSDHTH